MIEESWPGQADPIDVLERLFLLENSPFPLDYVRAPLKRGDPTDDRVRIGQANLAIWEGRFDLAKQWLDSCDQKPSNDQPLWLARLSLATSSGDFNAPRAVERVSVRWFLPSEVHRLRAWFAEFEGDGGAERDFLHACVAEEPGNTAALSRLSDLSLKAGQTAEAASYRKKQSEMGALASAYAHD